MSVFSQITEYKKVLKQMESWLDKASAHAEAKSFDVNVLMLSRLAPDQFAFNRQVQSTCDAAKFAAAYLSGQKAPSHPDTETTIDELRQRIHSVLGYLADFQESDFADAATRKISPGWLRGKSMTGDDYFHQASIPNFYFHAATAYAILRHNGVPLGKMDYLGAIPIQD